MSDRTLRLFDAHPEQHQFTATVQELDANRIVLDRSAFYPELGGQVSDRGTLDGISVARVELELADTKVVNGSQVSVNGIIVHYVDGDTSHLEVGASIVGAVDILRRRKIEALHSASHIMEEFLFAEISGFERVGSYVNEIKDRSDYNTASRLTADQLALIERKINEFISLDYPIETWLENDIKYWKCGPFKTMCSGTHPSSTRHIGRVSLKRKNQGRGLERIETTLVER